MTAHPEFFVLPGADELYEPEPEERTSPSTILPASFWTERSYLRHIRQAAHSRQRAPDAVLGAVLARTAALVPHTLALPAPVGTAKPLSLLVAIISPPGTGKSDATGIAGEIVQGDVHEIPSGSGEGIAEAFFDIVDVVDANGKPKKEKQLVRHNLLIDIDEGQKATRQSQQSGSTLFPTLRHMFTGRRIGEQNASADRRRAVDAGQYAVGVVAGFQPETIGPLFDELPFGTPQRFLYFAGTDPTLPETRPRWPGWLEPVDIDLERAEHLPLATWRHHIRLHVDVADEIVAADRRRHTGEDVSSPWDAHRALLRMKVAALLAILHVGRLLLTPDDWRLAGMVVDVSDAVRDEARRTIAKVAADREAATSTRLARRVVQGDVMTRERRVLDCVDVIVAKVRREPGQLTRGTLRATVGPGRRDFFGEAFDKAVDAGEIEERSDPGQGEDRRRLYPARTRS